MKYLYTLLTLGLTIGFVALLNKPLTINGDKTPRFGLFLSPQKGFWQNAESKNVSFDGNLKIKGISASTEVFFDERLVPHIYANTSNDAYFVQGFLHAKFRLWQMEFQTHIAAGRLSEIVGTKGLTVDKYFRRIGMVFAAENCLNYMMQDEEMKKTLDTYTAGVNAYIAQIKDRDIPFEYKLLDYKPEPWTNLKTALFLKLMSYDLTGQSNDLQYNNAKTFFGYEDYVKIFTNFQDTLDPIIPKGTLFETPSIIPQIPFNIDSGYLLHRDSFTIPRAVIVNKNNGSNNWAVDSSKSKDGRPILCNDPHLGLNLPSLWYELQITTPEYSVYGASFPGSPAVVIGFNDNIAWGVTNAGRDVKDYYEIQFKDSTLKQYWFFSEWQKTNFRKEVIKIKDTASITEKIAMTEFGPVMYDRKYPAKTNEGRYYALRWTAHDASNELQTFIKLNKATNFDEYRAAISSFECPGQNFIFASKKGDVAITQQGKFVARWKNQGDFVMKGDDSLYMWQGYIPANENPFMHNPSRGFVSSANQQVTDTNYGYYLGRASNFPPYRGYIINQKLSQSNSFTVDDMKEMQTNNYNFFAQQARPLLFKYIKERGLSDTAKKYLTLVKDWNLNNDHDEKAATIFQSWWDSVEHEIFDDDFFMNRLDVPWPDESIILENLLRDSSYSFCDNKFTSQKETIFNCVQAAFDKTVNQMIVLEKQGKLQWGKSKATFVQHLLKNKALSKNDIVMGGGTHCINATTKNHGPSWRMIVHLTDDVEAFGIYPGGQSGNPGSRFYDNFIDNWAAGKYYKLLFIKKEDTKNNNKLKWHLRFNKA
jgi:penicillin G amidase